MLRIHTIGPNTQLRSMSSCRHVFNQMRNCAGCHLRSCTTKPHHQCMIFTHTPQMRNCAGYHLRSYTAKSHHQCMIFTHTTHNISCELYHYVQRMTHTHTVGSNAQLRSMSIFYCYSQFSIVTFLSGPVRIGPNAQLRSMSISHGNVVRD